MSKFKNPSIAEIIRAIHCDRRKYDRSGNVTGWYVENDVCVSTYDTDTIFIASLDTKTVVRLEAGSSKRQISRVMNAMQCRHEHERNVYAFQYKPSAELVVTASDFHRIDHVVVADCYMQQATPDEIFTLLLDSNEVKAESYAAQVMHYMYMTTRAKAVKRAKEMLAEIARGERIEEIELPAIEF